MDLTVGMKKDELDTPFLWVDLDIMERNIANLAELFDRAGVGWRPHSKGIKVPAIIHKAIAAGALGVTCAKLSEAEVMSAAGIWDILIANQIVTPRKMRRLAQLARYSGVKVAVDDAQNVTELGEAALAAGTQIGVVIEIDLGMKRGGVAPDLPAVRLAEVAHQTDGIKLFGVMGWEGQASIVTDAEEKKVAVKSAVQLLTCTARQLTEHGLPVSIVSAGGSATASITSFIPGVTEIQAGGAIFSDILYQSRGVTNNPALFVHSTVTSHPAPNRLIFDAGFKALPAWNTTPRLLQVDGVESIRMSAEHGTVTVNEPVSEIRVGDAFDFIVSYGDYTVFLHDHLYGIRNGVVEVCWPIQGRGKLH